MQVEVNYYEILQVDRHASMEAIRKSYRALAREYHPDVNRDPSAHQAFQVLQEAYETLSDPVKRRTYDGLRAAAGHDKPSALNFRMMVSHRRLLTNVAEQVMYVLLDIHAAQRLATSRLPLNLCLVFDRSTSMHGNRLGQVKDAIYKLLEYLDGRDALSVVAFSDRADVVLPSQQNIDKASARSLISAVQASGGTEMFQGFKCGLEQLEKYRRTDSVNHLVLLTDGQTYGDEKECLEQAKWAGEHQISLTTMGLGTDWNETLLDEMASLSSGSSIYIDSPQKVADTFYTTLHKLSNVVAREVTMQINTSPDVRLAEAYQVTPDVHDLAVNSGLLALGPLSRDQEKRVLLELRIGLHSSSEQKRLARVKAGSDIPSQNNLRSWASLDIMAEFRHKNEAQPPPDIPQPLINILRKLTLFKVQKKAMADMEKGNVRAATQRLETLATQLLNAGEADLARVTLLEAGRLARTGQLSDEGRKKIHYGTRSLSMPS